MLALMLALLTVAAETETRQVTQADVLAYGKRLDVHRIDARIGSARYQDWLQRALGPDATIRWSGDDCAEGGRDDDFPVCLTADARLRPHGRVTVMIALGSARGSLGGAVLFFGSIDELGPSEVIRQGDLPTLAAKVRAARARAARLARMPDVLVDDIGWIGQVMLLPAARLDPRLPEDTAFGDWIDGRLGPGANADWYIAGCGARDGHGGPPVDLSGDKDEWAFVTGEFHDAQVDVGIEVRVGTCRKGPFGKPVVSRVRVYDKRPDHRRVITVPLDRLDATLGAIRGRAGETVPPR